MSNYDEGGSTAPLSRDPSGGTATAGLGQPAGAPMHHGGPMHGGAMHQGAPMHQHGPMHAGYGGGYGMGWQMRPRRVYPIETKPFFLTSEFFGAAAAIAGIAITAAASDAFGAWRAWILITAIVAAYLVSRGIAKSGTRSHADDPRENLDLNWGRGGDAHGEHR